MQFLVSEYDHRFKCIRPLDNGALLLVDVISLGSDFSNLATQIYRSLASDLSSQAIKILAISDPGLASQLRGLLGTIEDESMVE